MASRSAWFAAVLGGIVASSSAGAAGANGPIDIGSRRELMVDRLLIDRLEGAEHRLGRAEVAAFADTPPPVQEYATVLYIGGRYLWYTRSKVVPGAYWKTVGDEAGTLNEVTLLYESRDAIAWTPVKLDLYKVGQLDPRLLDYARTNQIDFTPPINIVLANEFGVNHNFTPFEDARPGVPAEQRFKAIGGKCYRTKAQQDAWTPKYGPGGLRAFVSPDGIHWKRLWDEPIIPNGWGMFDSQNVAFWSPAEGQYVCYFRHFKGGLRAIRRSTSKDFLHWTDPVDMAANLPGEHLYTNGTKPYFRAPHIHVGLPTRYVPEWHSATEVLLMTCRPGGQYDRPFAQAFIRPGPELGKYGSEHHVPTFGNRGNYIAYHVTQTGPREMSIYLPGGRRYVLRLDGFASVHAPHAGGEMLTRPLTFQGGRLTLNYATAANGSLRVEVQDAAGKAVPGFALGDCPPLTGDEVDGAVTWRGGDLGKLAGRCVRLRFALTDADLYALRFAE